VNRYFIPALVSTLGKNRWEKIALNFDNDILYIDREMLGA